MVMWVYMCVMCCVTALGCVTYHSIQGSYTCARDGSAELSALNLFGSGKPSSSSSPSLLYLLMSSPRRFIAFRPKSFDYMKQADVSL